ncbi:MAG: DUF5701 family protein [Mycobacteriales bacterium]
MAPLTVDEGVALVTHFPASLVRNHCTLAGSRRGEPLVPAPWISKRRLHPVLVPTGDPHSWLGVASTAARLGCPRWQQLPDRLP